MSASRGRELVQEQLRKVAARATHQVALRQGRELGIVLGCGYPKSGTVWLCQLLGTYLDLPYPRSYLAPIAMAAVVHGHWDYDQRLPKTVYVTRDGRDVLVSLYFHNMRILTGSRNPRRRQELARRYRAAFGPNFDATNSRANLKRFLELEIENPTGAHGTWADHVNDWACGRPDVALTRYEDLLTDTATTIATAAETLQLRERDMERAEATAALHAFAAKSARKPGEEDRSSFLRKGIAGDWKNHFTSEAARLFDEVAGDALLKAGYEADRNWISSVE